MRYRMRSSRNWQHQIEERCRHDQPSPLGFFMCLDNGLGRQYHYSLLSGTQTSPYEDMGLLPLHLDQEGGNSPVGKQQCLPMAQYFLFFPVWHHYRTTQGGALDHRDFLLLAVAGTSAWDGYEGGHCHTSSRAQHCPSASFCSWYGLCFGVKDDAWMPTPLEEEMPGLSLVLCPSAFISHTGFTQAI